MAADFWYYAMGGQQQGPVSTPVLLQMLAQGQLSPQDLVWREGMSGWQAAGDIAELASSIPQPGYPPGPDPYATGRAQPGAPPDYPYAQQGYPQQDYPQQGYPPQGYQQPYQQPLNYGYESHYANKFRRGAYASQASTAFTLSIVGIFCGGALLGIPALILGCLALSGMSRTGDDKGKGYAIAAVIIGAFESLAGVFVILKLMGS